jgi:beta-lactamase superfamily II metal-dependent hydrolase
MALEITVGPPRLAITHGYGVFITEQDGQIPWPTDKGFYHFQLVRLRQRRAVQPAE